MLNDDDAVYREGKVVNKKFYTYFEENIDKWTMKGDDLTTLLEYDIIE